MVLDQKSNSNKKIINKTKKKKTSLSNLLLVRKWKWWVLINCVTERQFKKKRKIKLGHKGDFSGRISNVRANPLEGDTSPNISFFKNKYSFGHQFH